MEGARLATILSCSRHLPIIQLRHLHLYLKVHFVPDILRPPADAKP